MDNSSKNMVLRIEKDSAQLLLFVMSAGMDADGEGLQTYRMPDGGRGTAGSKTVRGIVESYHR